MKLRLMVKSVYGGEHFEVSEEDVRKEFFSQVPWALKQSVAQRLPGPDVHSRVRTHLHVLSSIFFPERY